MARRPAAEAEPSAQTLVVGAGVAGLSFAATLVDRNADVVVLEKSRGVGGRCATRRVDGQPVDHGLAFYHGDDPEFLAALGRASTGTPMAWPRRVSGTGAPCHPQALRPGERSLAFRAGASVFPKHLARGVRVELETRVTRLGLAGERWILETQCGRRVTAPSIVLALPPEQTMELLRGVQPASRQIESITELLAGVSMVRCLTLIAGYPLGAALPDWDVCYPDASSCLQMISHDSTKRDSPSRGMLVLHARPRWSAECWGATTADWTAALLAAACEIAGERLRSPELTEIQRWRYARLAGGDELTAPLLVTLESGARIGVAGEALSPYGGVQAAWRSGRELALRWARPATRLQDPGAAGA